MSDSAQFIFDNHLICTRTGARTCPADDSAHGLERKPPPVEEEGGFMTVALRRVVAAYRRIAPRSIPASSRGPSETFCAPCGL